MPVAFDADILVAGAGPAGATAALGLARLGYSVCVVGLPRPFDACEGVSRRVVDALRQAGFTQALEHIPSAGLREVEWNGEHRAQNAECLTRRPEVDAALIADLQRAGVMFRQARIAALLHDDQAPGLRLADGTELRARVVVEARGRAAPQGRGVGLRGPATLAVLQRARGPAMAPGSAVFACADGWVWLARLANGERYAQFCVAADAPGLPKRPALAAWMRERITRLPQAQAWLDGCTLEGPPVARASTALLHARAWERGVLRVGDAAMAIDPLSGNGIFQSMSSATTAPAVINTLLRHPADAELALGFHAERLRDIFLRFARIGRDFYAAETRWADVPFWRERTHWPDAAPAHAQVPGIECTALRPVIEDGLIRQREVLITSEQPLGVWRVEGVEVAPLLHDLPGDPAARVAVLGSRITAATSMPGQRRQLEAWLQRHGIDTVPPRPSD